MIIIISFLRDHQWLTVDSLNRYLYSLSEDQLPCFRQGYLLQTSGMDLLIRKPPCDEHIIVSPSTIAVFVFAAILKIEIRFPKKVQTKT